MKKLFSALLVTVLLISAMILTACPAPTPGEPPVEEHVHTLVQEIVAPTCSEDGYTHHYCTECGYEWEDTFVPADKKYHDYVVAEVVDPTCYEKGYTKTVCTHCGDEIIEYVDASHKLGEWVVIVEPSCTSVGEMRRYCQVEGCTYHESNVIHAQHNYAEIMEVVEPTCDQQGYILHTCSDCGHQYKDSYIKANGHTYGEWILAEEGSCTEYGKELRQCQVCGHVEGRLTSENHNYEATVVEATCTTLGYTSYECKDCGHSYVEYGTEFKHSYGEWVVYVSPTCTTFGLQRRSCTDCGCVEEVLMNPQHVYDTVIVVEPTKETSGYTEYICKCGDSYKDNYVPALGGNELEYELRTYWDDETHTYISEYIVVGIGDCKDTSIVIPTEYEGIPVTTISYMAFYNLDHITEIYLPASVTKFDVAAFWNCDSLVTFHYEGTVEQWNLIDKGINWDNGLGEYVIICEDGIITK